MVKNVHVIIFLACFWGFCFPFNAESTAKSNSSEVIDQGFQSIPDFKFKRCLLKYLCRNLGKEESDIIVSKVKVSRNRAVPVGKISIRLSRKDTGRLAGNVKLNAIVSVNGIEENNVRIYSWIDVFESVVCASRDLKRKDIIREDDVYLARKNISHMPPNTVRGLSKVVGLTMKHNVKADTCLKGWMVEKTPAVKRGDMVTIMAESDDLKVTIPGRVMEKGCLGELVKVENIISKKEIYARVINNLAVMVNF